MPYPDVVDLEELSAGELQIIPLGLSELGDGVSNCTTRYQPAPAIGHDDLQDLKSATTVAISRNSVVRRLLIIDVVHGNQFTNYRRQNGALLPKALVELNLDPGLLIDAFASDHSMIRYCPDLGGKYTLYSVGPDGVDNGGEPIGDEKWVGDGDYMLDSLYPKRTLAVPK